MSHAASGQTPDPANDAKAALARAQCSASEIRASMDAARNTVAYWKQAYEDERDENQRLRAKLRQTKKYLRDANKGALGFFRLQNNKIGHGGEADVGRSV